MTNILEAVLVGGEFNSNMTWVLNVVYKCTCVVYYGYLGCKYPGSFVASIWMMVHGERDTPMGFIKEL